jgi:hypothetical protein
LRAGEKSEALVREEAEAARVTTEIELAETVKAKELG